MAPKAPSGAPLGSFYGEIHLHDRSKRLCDLKQFSFWLIMIGRLRAVEGFPLPPLRILAKIFFHAGGRRGGIKKLSRYIHYNNISLKRRSKDPIVKTETLKIPSPGIDPANRIAKLHKTFVTVKYSTGPFDLFYGARSLAGLDCPHLNTPEGATTRPKEPQLPWPTQE